MLTDKRRQPDGLDLTALRARLAGKQGPRYWRSLEELAETPEFFAYIDREFPRQASDWNDGPSRRTFLKLMGASLALAGVSGCMTSEPAEKIVPYVRLPEQLVPGKPLYFATQVPLAGYATGVIVESHMGRPTMVEGNEKHPDSQGAIDPWTQATVLTLYDPDRSQVVSRREQISTWDNFLLEAAGASAIAAVPRKRGGVADPDRDGNLAHPGAADPRPDRRIPRGEVAPVRTRRRRPHPRWRPGSPFGEDVAVRYHV